MTAVNAHAANAPSSALDPNVEQALRAYIAAREARIALNDAIIAADRDLEVAARELHAEVGSLRRAADLVGVNESTIRYDARIGTKGRTRRPKTASG